MQQQQQRSVVNLCPVNHIEPFSPSDHMGPQLTVKEKVWEDVVPPAMVCRCLILPLLADPMEGGLGDLHFSQRFYQEEAKREITSSVVG